MNDTTIPEPFVLQADAPPPPAPTPETDAVWADKSQNILEHAKHLERQRDATRRALVETLFAYDRASEVARVTLGVVKASLDKGLHHSRPALEQAVALCEERLDNISKGLPHRED
jgi:ribosomal protein S4